MTALLNWVCLKKFWPRNNLKNFTKSWMQASQMVYWKKLFCKNFLSPGKEKSKNTLFDILNFEIRVLQNWVCLKNFDQEIICKIFLSPGCKHPKWCIEKTILQKFSKSRQGKIEKYIIWQTQFWNARTSKLSLSKKILTKK